MTKRLQWVTREVGVILNLCAESLQISSWKDSSIGKEAQNPDPGTHVKSSVITRLLQWDLRQRQKNPQNLAGQLAWLVWQPTRNPASNNMENENWHWGCPLTSLCVLWHKHAHIYVHKHTHYIHHILFKSLQMQLSLHKLKLLHSQIQPIVDWKYWG